VLYAKGMTIACLPKALQVILVILCMIIYGTAAITKLIRTRQLDQPQASLEHEEQLNKSLARAVGLQNRWGTRELGTYSKVLSSAPPCTAGATLKRSTRSRARTASCGMRGRCYKNAFWLVSLLYPNIAQTALQLFSAQKLDIGTFLRADYQIMTHDVTGQLDPTYKQYIPPGIIILIVFAVGLPVMFFYVLWRVRDRLEVRRCSGLGKRR